MTKQAVAWQKVPTMLVQCWADVPAVFGADLTDPWLTQCRRPVSADDGLGLCPECRARIRGLNKDR